MKKYKNQRKHERQGAIGTGPEVRMTMAMTAAVILVGHALGGHRLEGDASFLQSDDG